MLLVLILLALAAGAGLYFAVPGDRGGLLGKARQAVVVVVDSAKKALGLEKAEPPRLIKFETAESSVTTGVKTVFTFTFDSSVDGVRITDEEGNPINGTVASSDPPSNTIWTLSVIFERSGSRTLLPSMRKEDVWYAGDKRIDLVVWTPTPLPSLTPEPTLVPTPVFTSVPTAVPTRVPTSLPTAIPTPLATPLLTLAPTPLTTPVAAITAAPSAFVVLPPAAVATSPAGGVATAATLFTTAAPVATTLSVVPDATAPPTSSPVPKPTMSPMPLLPATATADTSPTRLRITEAAYRGAKKQAEFSRERSIDMPAPDAYTAYEGGVFTFRGDAFRRNAAFGTAEVERNSLSIEWQAPIGSMRTSSGTVYGMGWTGQPAIVKWSVEVRKMMNILPEKKEVTALKEVIFAAQDGKVYFLDLNDGAPTRDPISVGYPLKGSVAVDTQGRPMIAFGQGISELPNKRGPIGFYLYGLIDQKELYFINGRKTTNQTQYASNGAFDGTALFDLNSDSLVVAGENGLFYTVDLNTDFDFQEKFTLSVDPKVAYLKSKGNQQDKTVGMETSVAMYGRYAYMADSYGITRCVDTDTMQTVWAVDCGDNTDAAMALGFDGDGSLGLFTGNTAFTRLGNREPVTIRRLDALTGEEQWSYNVKAKYDKTERSGCKASPIIGENAIGHLVIFTVNMTEDGASVIALDRKSGAEVWRTPIAAGAISSPVAVYNQAGEAFIIQGDLGGRLTMMEGMTGRVLTSLDLGGSIEGSPAVYSDMLVVGTSSKDNANMYGVRIE